MRLRMAGNLFETSGQRDPCIWRAKAPQTRLNARSGQWGPAARGRCDFRTTRPAFHLEAPYAGH